MPIPAFLAPALQTGAGIVQSIFGGGRARRAQRELERLPTPIYEGSKSLADYYQKALSRYNTNPYNTSLYNQQMRNVGRGTAGALGAIQDRRGGVSSIARILQAGNDASLNAAAAAEQQQAQNFSQLGSASQALTADQMRQFEINKLMPYQVRANMLSAKAGGGANIFNAGLSNIFGGLQSFGQNQLLSQLYGTDSINTPNVNGPQASTYQVPLANTTQRRGSLYDTYNRYPNT